MTRHAAAAALCALAATAITPTATRAADLTVQSYTYEQSPWAYVDSTGRELTDGTWSTTGINPADLWVGWDGGSARVVFDLGASQHIGGSSIIYCQWGNAAVYLPTSVDFQFSDDPTFATSTTLSFPAPAELIHGGVTVERDYDFSPAPTARYVRLVADHDFQWLFIGEVQFTAAVPEPASAGILAGAATLVAKRRRRI